MVSEGRPVIIGSSDADKIKFPPGFSYRVGGIIYTVVRDVTQEINSPMREMNLSDGTTEIATVSSITLDLKEHDATILPIVEKYAIKTSIKTVKKTVAKKKVAKKKIKKKTKKND